MTDYIARFRANDNIRTHNSYLYLFPVADLTDRFRIVAKRILASQFLGDTGKCRIGIRDRICLEFTAAAVLGKRQQVLPPFFIFRGALPAAAAHVDITARDDRPENVSHRRSAAASSRVTRTGIPSISAIHVA